MRKITLLIALVFLLIPDVSLSANRVFFEDFEATDFQEHFAERSYGTNYSSYWESFKTANRRSSNDPFGGNYCMTTDEFNDSTSGRSIGLGDCTYGNTSNFSLATAITGTNAYFRWRLKFESGIDWSGIEHKILYVNYQDQGDFVLTIKKCGSSSFHLTGKSQTPYVLRENLWISYSGGNLDDNQWHTYEVYMAWTGTGDTGTLWIKIDGIDLYRNEGGWYYRDSDEPGPDILHVAWPSNISGTPAEGDTCVMWVDDLEIWDAAPTAPNPPSNLEIKQINP